MKSVEHNRGCSQRKGQRHVKFTMAFLCIATALLWTASSNGLAAEITIAPGQSCVSAGCHDTLGKAKSVHAAMEDGECSVCHDQQNDIHAFELAAEDNELCYSCHDPFEEKKNQHAAIEEGCTLCHDAHQSDSKSLLKVEPISDICFECHDQSIIETKRTHGPAEAAECSLCHNPHESDNATLLVQDTPALCFVCHTDVQQALEESDAIHAATDEGCSTCHNPHGAEYDFLLSEEVPQLCYSCHDDVEEIVTSATYKHVVDKDKRCLNCHLPHASKHEGLLTASPEALCFACHDKEIKTDSGTVKNIKNAIEDRKYVHAPVAEDECSACHNPHGSKHGKILAEAYPGRMYAPFSEENYALCFECHDHRFVLFEKTTKLTGFRHGNVNLHYLHVNKPVKGRSCSSCHDAHAADHQHMIKETVPFGTWDMPMRFKKTETGGSCYPGCHKKQAYDRDEPLKKQ